MEKPIAWMGTCKVEERKADMGRWECGEWGSVNKSCGGVFHCRWHFFQTVHLSLDGHASWEYVSGLTSLLAWPGLFELLGAVSMDRVVIDEGLTYIRGAWCVVRGAWCVVHGA